MTDPSNEVATFTHQPPTPDTRTPARLVHDAIANQREAFALALPHNVDPDRFARLCITAIKSSPQLVECFDSNAGQLSVLTAAMQCAAVGLEPNTPRQHAWILPRRIKGATEAQLQIGYRGYIDLAKQAGVTIIAEVVRDGDDFDFGVDRDGPYLTWRPGPDGGRGDRTGAFAMALAAGQPAVSKYLDREAIEDRRARSDSWRNEKARPYSPWTTSPDAMWCKSAVRALIPYVQLGALDVVAAADERVIDIDPDTGQITPRPEENQ